MHEPDSLADCFSDDCPSWIDKATVQQRYNISDKKLKKWINKKTYVIRLHSKGSMKYWEPDIRRMLECERTGQPYTESELLAVIEANCPIAEKLILIDRPLLFGTLCLLACWTVAPRYGFYNAGFAAWNIVILIIGAGAAFYSTVYGERAYRYARRMWERQAKHRGL